jgi:hypothetical protein
MVELRANAKGEESRLVTAHEEYLRLGRTPSERHAAYRDLFGLVSADQLDEIRCATNSGYVLGTPSFKATMSRTLGRRVESGCLVGAKEKRRPTINWICSNKRGLSLIRFGADL